MNLVNISIFIAANILGFLGISLAYNLGISLNLLDIDSQSNHTAALQQQFFTGASLTWLVCAVFSISFLFLHNNARLIFLTAPVILPFGYGLGTLWLSAS